MNLNGVRIASGFMVMLKAYGSTMPRALLPSNMYAMTPRACWPVSKALPLMLQLSSGYSSSSTEVISNQSEGQGALCAILLRKMRDYIMGAKTQGVGDVFLLNNLDTYLHMVHLLQNDKDVFDRVNDYLRFVDVTGMISNIDHCLRPFVHMHMNKLLSGGVIVPKYLDPRMVKLYMVDIIKEDESLRRLAKKYIVDTIVNKRKMPTYINKETIQYALFPSVVKVSVKADGTHRETWCDVSISVSCKGYLLDLSHCNLKNDQLILMLQYINKSFPNILKDTASIDLSYSDLNIGEADWQRWYGFAPYVVCWVVRHNATEDYLGKLRGSEDRIYHSAIDSCGVQGRYTPPSHYMSERFLGGNCNVEHATVEIVKDLQGQGKHAAAELSKNCDKSQKASSF